MSDCVCVCRCVSDFVFTYDGETEGETELLEKPVRWICRDLHRHRRISPRGPQRVGLPVKSHPARARRRTVVSKRDDLAVTRYRRPDRLDHRLEPLEAPLGVARDEDASSSSSDDQTPRPSATGWFPPGGTTPGGTAPGGTTRLLPPGGGD